MVAPSDGAVDAGYKSGKTEVRTWLWLCLHTMQTARVLTAKCDKISC